MKKETNKSNLLNLSSEKLGSTSFFFMCLKNVIDSEKEMYRNVEITEKLREQIQRKFLYYINQLPIVTVKGVQKNSELYDFVPSPIVENISIILKNGVTDFFNNSSFLRAFNQVCNDNDLESPYNNDEVKIFVNDLMILSLSKVVEIINLKTTEFISYKFRNNEIPSIEDQQESKYGNLDIFLTLNGLINFNVVEDLKDSSKLITLIKNKLSNEFEILPEDVINEKYDVNETIAGDKINSSLILGKEVSKIQVYNPRFKTNQTKITEGYLWFDNFLHGVEYNYLNFKTYPQNNGQYDKTITLENAICSYYIIYIKKTRWKLTVDDLLDEGYSLKNTSSQTLKK